MSAFQPVYADCDERIKKIEEDIKFYEYKCLLTRLGLPPFHASSDVHKRTQNEKSWKGLKNCQNKLRLVKMEKMIYEAHEQQRTATLPLLFKKYNESVDLSLTLERNVETNEEIYREFCEKAEEQRNYIKTMCGVV